MIPALLVFLFPLAYSPGPGNLFFAAAGARFGARATIAASAGYHIATWLVTLAIGFGGFAALSRMPAVFDILKVLGALYVMWIAWRFLQAAPDDSRASATSARFTDGVVLLLFNPKAYVIIALMFTQFLSASGQNAWEQVLLITTIFTLNNLLAFTIWTLAGARLARVFNSPEQSRILNMIFAFALFAVAVWMLVTLRPPLRA